MKQQFSLASVGMSALSTLLLGTLVIGCNKSGSNPDNIPGAPTTAVSTASVSPMNFDDAANTWSQIEQARVGMDTAIREKKLDQVHEATSKIRDLVKTLPDKSLLLAEDKRKTLDAHIKNVGELAGMMDKFNDSNDSNEMKSAQEHHTAMNDALNMMKGIYPEEAMHSSMHMPNMDSSDKNMSDKNMSDDNTPGKMGGMGKMGGEMPGMDKMTSGMSDVDKSEMKMLIDKMMAMPPDERKKAMQKMSGMGTPTDPGKMSGDM